MLSHNNRDRCLGRKGRYDRCWEEEGKRDRCLIKGREARCGSATCLRRSLFMKGSAIAFSLD